jgi:hypothetical protein
MNRTFIATCVLAVAALSACAGDGNGEPTESSSEVLGASDLEGLRASISNSDDLTPEQKAQLLAAEVVELEPIEEGGSRGVDKAILPNMSVSVWTTGPTDLFLALRSPNDGHAGIFKLPRVDLHSRYSAVRGTSGEAVIGSIPEIWAWSSPRITTVHWVITQELNGGTVDNSQCWFGFRNTLPNAWLKPDSCR